MPSNTNLPSLNTDWCLSYYNGNVGVSAVTDKIITIADTHVNEFETHFRPLQN